MADTTNRLAGLAYIRVDGQTYMLAADLTYRVSKVTRDTLTGQDTVHGYAEKPLAGRIAGTFRDAGSLTVANFNAMTNVTVTVELANGKTVVGRNMWTVESQEVKTAEATFEVAFEGLDVEES
ncbi:MAG: phage tail tube protein [Collimonas sp.]|uniref:phage tail tube protein n=1 Tax=Collimonas sp. TaxID=1963772 RepID=UPI0032641B67